MPQPSAWPPLTFRKPAPSTPLPDLPCPRDPLDWGCSVADAPLAPTLQSVIALLGVAAAGAIGAPLRYVIDQWVQSRTEGRFPWGTLAINISGSFVLGMVTGLSLYHGLGDLPKTVVGTGLCGAYTTFSTFSYETVRLVEEGELAAAARNTAGSMILGLLAAAAGLAIASA